jgi:alkanesulfonate monooxygenase SsuD/methylene tetrahydromethanopterin reductase-like flavin-dependent oxidoreductase (luciferase family)
VVRASPDQYNLAFEILLSTWESLMTTKPVALTVFQPSAQQTIAAIQFAEQLGIPQVWMPTLPVAPDPLPTLAAAAVKTSTIGLATGVSVTYMRHPLTLANAALALAELAPNRFRLGIGASYPFIVSGMYGLTYGKPLAHLREYLAVLRGLLWEGTLNFDGDYYHVHVNVPPFIVPPRIPIVMATVRPKVFRLAGELADGAMVSWGPISYLKKFALPALEEGAKAANRPRPPLIASAPIIFDTDFGNVRQAAHNALGMYVAVPAYIEMFQLAGFSIGPNGQLPDELIQETFIYGDEATIRQRLLDMFAQGADELQTVICPVKDPMNEGRAIMEILGTL